MTAFHDRPQDVIFRNCSAKFSQSICSTLQKIKEDLQYTANVLLAVTASDDNEIFGKDEPSTGRKDHRNPPDHGISDGGVIW